MDNPGKTAKEELIFIKLQAESINPFVSNAPFLYTQKTSENLKVSWS